MRTPLLGATSHTRLAAGTCDRMRTPMRTRTWMRMRTRTRARTDAWNAPALSASGSPTSSAHDRPAPASNSV